MVAGSRGQVLVCESALAVPLSAVSLPRFDGGSAGRSATCWAMKSAKRGFVLKGWHKCGANVAANSCGENDTRFRMGR